MATTYSYNFDTLKKVSKKEFAAHIEKWRGERFFPITVEDGISIEPYHNLEIETVLVGVIRGKAEHFIFAECADYIDE